MKRRGYLLFVLLFILSTLLVYQKLMFLQLPEPGFDMKLADVRHKQRQTKVAQVEQVLLQYGFAELACDSLLWPDPSLSMRDRTLNQLRSLKEYARRTNGTVRPMKVILTVGPPLCVINMCPLESIQRSMEADKCPIKDCFFTNDTQRYQQTADALLILDINKHMLKDYLPKPAHQLWIAANHRESPVHSHIHAYAMNNYINWSWTYRPDSHILMPFSLLVPLPTTKTSADNRLHRPLDINSSTTNYASGKTKMAAWFVSNCWDSNGRMGYAKELSKHIQVDIYGGCGKPCREVSCFELLKKEYKFYLSFENSNCNYYITEKVYRNAFSNNILPIVMGARPEDYAAALPPHSYIHVDDFPSPQELAKYLLRLNANDTLYNEYFQWKSKWYEVPYFHHWCRICGLLHAASELKYVHWYENYTRWFDGDEVKTCGARWVQQNGNKWQTWRRFDLV